MAHIPARHPDRGYTITDASELASSPTLAVDVGTAPDGLPWILAIDRAPRLRHLYNAVVTAFELHSADDLPLRVRSALTADVASGLMGVHTTSIAGEPSEVYVSRRPLSRLVGNTLLEQVLVASHDTPVAPPPERMCATSANPVGYDDVDAAARFDDALRESQTRRHLLVRLSDGSAHVGSVAPEDRALRTPSGSVRRLVRESLAGFTGAVARFGLDGSRWEVDAGDTGEYLASLSRVSDTFGGGVVRYLVPRQSVLEILVRLADELGALHRRGLVHGDLSPANVLVENGRPVAFDALGIESGQIAFAATFDWAAPEQVLARPLDPRADVYAVGKMLCGLIGGVPFGEKTTYTVPVGGVDARDVAMLKTDGVYVDIQQTEHDREWQRAWSEILARALAFDRDRRPETGPALAAELREIAERFPVDGRIEIAGTFGSIVPMQRPATWSFARCLSD
jgi:hypothetical protein